MQEIPKQSYQRDTETIGTPHAEMRVGTLRQPREVDGIGRARRIGASVHTSSPTAHKAEACRQQRMNKVLSGWRKVKSKWCQACLMHEASEVHHIKWRCDGGGNEESNLIDLCRLCHKHAPSDPDEFQDYKERHGHYGIYFRLGFDACMHVLLKDQNESFLIRYEKSQRLFKQAYALTVKTWRKVLKAHQQLERDLEKFRKENP